MGKYIIFGVEHVYDAFDEYEHPNHIPPIQILASSTEEAVSTGRKFLQEIITEQRRADGFLSSGEFIAEVVIVLDEGGQEAYRGDEKLVVSSYGYNQPYNLIPSGFDSSVSLPEFNPEKNLVEQFRGIITKKQFSSNIILLPTDLELVRFISEHPNELYSLTPRQFEEFVADILSAKFGYKVRLSPMGRDGGIDIYAEKQQEFGLELLLVQCKKHRRDHKVGQPIVKQLNADVYDRKASRGLVVTTSYFTKPALNYIEQVKYRLSGADIDKFHSWIRSIKHKSPTIACT